MILTILCILFGFMSCFFCWLANLHFKDKERATEKLRGMRKSRDKWRSDYYGIQSNFLKRLDERDADCALAMDLMRINYEHRLNKK